MIEGVGDGNSVGVTFRGGAGAWTVRSELRRTMKNSVIQINATPTETALTIIFVCFVMIVTWGYRLKSSVPGQYETGEGRKLFLLFVLIRLECVRRGNKI